MKKLILSVLIMVLISSIFCGVASAQIFGRSVLVSSNMGWYNFDNVNPINDQFVYRLTNMVDASSATGTVYAWSYVTLNNNTSAVYSAATAGITQTTTGMFANGLVVGSVYHMFVRTRRASGTVLLWLTVT